MANKKYQILIVDDSRSIRALLEEIIATSVSEISVSSLGSSKEALAYMKEHTVDLILSDINMPKMDGFEFAKELNLNSHTKDIPVIFITASSNTDEFVQKGFALGAIDYIQKPFDEILLANKIRSYVKLFKKEREVKQAYKMISNILAHMDNLICIITEKEIVKVNKTFLEFFHFESLEALQTKHHNLCDFFILEEDYLIHEISSDMNNKKLIKYLLANQSRDTKIKLYDEEEKEEKVFILKLSAMNSDEKNTQYIVSLTDITETERLKKSYQVQAIIDPLTQIYNRQAFNDKYPKEFYSAKTMDKSLIIIIADIDHFKCINDNYGHQIGDYVLKEFCKVVNQVIPNNYFFARWGGEEFVILALGDTLEEAIKSAEKVRVAVQKHEFLHIGYITSSFGVSTIKNSDDENALLARVDEALYKAKKQGRNQVVLL